MESFGLEGSGGVECLSGEMSIVQHRRGLYYISGRVVLHLE